MTINSRFADGDRVISIRDTSDVPEGFIGTLQPTPQSCFDYKVVSDEGKVELFNEDELELLRVSQPVKPDAVNHPKHYAVFEQLEAIEVIASSMTADQFYGYCLGNILKYRLRAGGKDDVMQELGKADKYQELFTKYKHLCKGVQ